MITCGCCNDVLACRIGQGKEGSSVFERSRMLLTIKLCPHFAMGVSNHGRRIVGLRITWPVSLSFATSMLLAKASAVKKSVPCTHPFDCGSFEDDPRVGTILTKGASEVCQVSFNSKAQSPRL